MELTENTPGQPLDLTSQQAAAIAETSAHWRNRLKLREEPLRVSIGADQQYYVEARGVAGFVRVAGQTLEIAPKFINRDTVGPGWRAAMWRFLAYGHGIEALSDAAGTASVEEGIADVLADMFLSSLSGAAARGYPVGYRAAEVTSPFLKGRLNPRHYAKLIPPSGKLHLIASVLTTDIPTNRLLKWAGGELAATVEDPERRMRLLNWMGELPSVVAAAPAARSVPTPRRHHPYLVHALEIAKLLLDDRTAGYENGELVLPGFLWDAENLFERAVRRLIADSCRPLGLSVMKTPHQLAEVVKDGTTSRLETTPDITIRGPGGTVAIMDAKYKKLKTHPKNEDLYQVLAGGRVTDVASVTLLYPAADTSLASQTYTPAGCGFPSKVNTLTIGLGAFSSRSDTRRLRDQLTAWISHEVNSIPRTRTLRASSPTG